ncbi:hypothetical protein J4558_27295 [Leptolyngbya sp. 15MV]|nr:hypothetical protein J4558_27295 [Leptolyngbya sp. 15MV]
MIRHALLAGAMLCLVAAPLAASDISVPAYPETRAEQVVETQFGEDIADPYRWLENDVRNDPEVAQWVERQNQATGAVLAQLPARDWFKARIAALTDYERFGIPRKAGSNYFYTRNSGLQNQSQLFVQAGLEGERRLLIDPNAWAADGATALSDWQPSENGRLLAYSVQDGGTDWRIIRVLDVETGEPLGDEIRWAKFTSIAWVGNEGFLYSRFPAPEEGQDFQALNYNQAVWFHRIGTPQSEDVLVFATPDRPELGHGAEVSDDSRWAVMTSWVGTDAKYDIHVIDLAARARDGWKAWNHRGLVSGVEGFSA